MRSCSPGGGSGRRAWRWSRAVRDDVPRIHVPWLERLPIEPLDDAEARELLGAADRAGRRGPADRHRGREPVGAAGDPGAAVARRSSPGASRSRTRCGPGTDVERAFAARSRRCRRRRSARCWSRRRRAPGGWTRSAAGCGLGLSLIDLEPAEAARIVTLADGELEFRHPLLRSTVYHGASATAAAAHAALAAATEGAERAWHLAACAVAPDEAVAAALEQAALEARGRGAHATAMRDLTPRRAAHAGRRSRGRGGCWPRPATRCAAARPSARTGLLDEAAALTDDPLLAADVERMRGHVEMRRGSPVAAHERLVREADRVRAARPAPRRRDVPRGVGRAHDDRRPRGS